MTPSMDLLTPFNYHQWKEDIEIQLHSKGLYRVTMEMEVELIHYVDKAKYWNMLDEAFGFLCLLISKDLLFHMTGLQIPKEI